MKQRNNRIIIKKLVKEKKDLDILDAFRKRIVAVIEDEALTHEDALKTILSVYTFIRIITPDSKMKNASDVLIERFIQSFLDAMDEHIILLKKNEMDLRIVNVKTNALEK